MNRLYKSKKLHYAFSRLYADILVAFESMLEWLSQSRLKHVAGSVVFGSDYGKRIDDALLMVKQRSIDVKEHAARCSQFVIGRIDENVATRK
jgi:hypothetical protein